MDDFYFEKLILLLYFAFDGNQKEKKDFIQPGNDPDKRLIIDHKRSWKHEALCNSSQNHKLELAKCEEEYIPASYREYLSS